MVDLFTGFTKGEIALLVGGTDRSGAISEGVRKYWDNISKEGYKYRCEVNNNRWTAKERLKASQRSEEQWAGYSEDRRREILDKVFLNEDYRKAFAEQRKNMTPEETEEWINRSFHNPQARKLGTRNMRVGLKSWWASLSKEDKEKELRKRIHSPKAFEASRIGLIERWKGLSNEQRMMHLKNSFWKDEVLHRRGNTQTEPEAVVERWLGRNKPGEWKYVGASKEVIIGGKAPDFININGKKEVIEVFGLYWHSLDEVGEKIAHYKKYGFGCKVIWDFECYDPEEIERLLGGKVDGL